MVFFSQGKDDGELKEETTKGDGGFFSITVISIIWSKNKGTAKLAAWWGSDFTDAP